MAVAALTVRVRSLGGPAIDTSPSLSVLGSVAVPSFTFVSRGDTVWKLKGVPDTAVALAWKVIVARVKVPDTVPLGSTAA
jgi:hypothetical protein